MTSPPALRTILRRTLAIATLAAGLALVGACGGSDDGDQPTGAADGAAGEATERSGGGEVSADGAVTIQDFEFEPQTIRVAPGTEVTWTNRDSAIHTVKDQGDLFGESDDLGEGDTFSFTYEEPGEHPYICGIHQYMTGTVVVEG